LTQLQDTIAIHITGGVQHAPTNIGASADYTHEQATKGIAATTNT